MNKELTWLGHNCWLLKIEETSFLIDPFLQTSQAPCKPEEVSADYILISHGHADHCADALAIAKKTGATVVTIAEIAGWFNKHGVLKSEPMNIGGCIPVSVKTRDSLSPVIAQIMMVPALHSSTMADGASGGNSVGFVLSFPQNGLEISSLCGAVYPMQRVLSDANAFSIYFACDTGFFREMEWIGKLGINVAVLPIGDRYTMGPCVSLDAIQALRPEKVVPSHYNTWPPLVQDIRQWVNAVREFTDVKPIIPVPGEAINL